MTTTWSEGTPRADELAAALAVLRAGEPRFLGYADARVPDSAPGAPRLVDADVDEAVRRLVGQLREFRPHTVITHDSHGGVTGHPDHVRTSRIVVAAVEAAGRAADHPDQGPPWQVTELLFATHPASALPMLRDVLGDVLESAIVPDTEVSVTLDVTEWLGQKVEAILAHRIEVVRGAAPGIVAASSPEQRRRLLGTEWYIRRTPGDSD